MIKTIIFDFDGVLVESVDIKTDAFRELFKGLPDKLEEIVKFHVDNGGMSRFDKFKHIYSNILKRPLSDNEFKRLCKGFSNLVVEKVVAAPFVNGTLAFLRKNAARYNMFVVSATPEEEIKKIIIRRKIERYFLGVYGSPRSKEKLLLEILKGNNYSPREAIFIGDSINDYHAARRAKVRFAARVPGGKGARHLPDVKLRFRDIFGLSNYLTKA